MDQTRIVDYADARNMMVDGQVRPNKVTDSRVLEAMRRLPRERFVPPILAPLAYSDEDIRLPGGRALMEPMVIARLMQAAALHAGERVLVVAAGSGYGAALAAACGAEVTALEEDEALLAMARAVLPEVAPGVAVVAGRLADGWNAAAPYDVVLIEGGVDAVPDPAPGRALAEGGDLSRAHRAGGDRRAGAGPAGALVPETVRLRGSGAAAVPDHAGLRVLRGAARARARARKIMAQPAGLCEKTGLCPSLRLPRGRAVAAF
jgi:protein-L-isoaspartate(D-aspartate) O-methyltransferase